MANTLVKSLRISPELWGDVEAYAKRNNLSPNAAACFLLAEGLEGVSATTLAPKPFKAPQRASTGLGDGIQIGPVRPEYGQLLKKGK